ncbi:MAG: hypothetical protein SFY70_00595 [Bacteroidia bacterium]|nr:hypothetical protein [Bacteroidia bacterium]
MAEVRELEERLKAAKRFVNTEITNRKLRRSKLTQLPTVELLSIQDNLHEVERLGLRNLDDMRVIKIERVLTSIEALMNLSSN